MGLPPLFHTHKGLLLLLPPLLNAIILPYEREYA